MNRREHWDTVFSTRSERDVSWFEALPSMSIRMIEACGLTPETCVIDVGGGDSRLVDQLAAKGLTCLAVLDLSGTALRCAQSRLGPVAAALTWIESDVTEEWSLKPMDIWHDRAVFHFLVDAHDRARYRDHLRERLKSGGNAIIATFAPDGPEKCSGFPVRRYSADAVGSELGEEFQLVEAAPYLHRTPWGTTQSFQYSRFRRH